MRKHLVAKLICMPGVLLGCYGGDRVEQGPGCWKHDASLQLFAVQTCRGSQWGAAPGAINADRGDLRGGQENMLSEVDQRSGKWASQGQSAALRRVGRPSTEQPIEQSVEPTAISSRGPLQGLQDHCAAWQLQWTSRSSATAAFAWGLETQCWWRRPQRHWAKCWQDFSETGGIPGGILSYLVSCFKIERAQDLGASIAYWEIGKWIEMAWFMRSPHLQCGLIQVVIPKLPQAGPCPNWSPLASFGIPGWFQGRWHQGQKFLPCIRRGIWRGEDFGRLLSSCERKRTWWAVALGSFLAAGQGLCNLDCAEVSFQRGNMVHSVYEKRGSASNRAMFGEVLQLRCWWEITRALRRSPSLRLIGTWRYVFGWTALSSRMWN